MREHILCTFSSQVYKKPNPDSIYDFSTQISYCDKKLTKKIIDNLMSDRGKGTFNTDSVETSDKDYYFGQIPSTVLTENIEQSDSDNLHLCGSTIETRGTEMSDIDNLWKTLSTMTTFSSENTDTDN